MTDVWKRLDAARADLRQSSRELEQPRPELRLMPTGDAAPGSGNPFDLLHDRLVAAVDALEPRGVARRRAKLSVVREGDEA